MKATKRSAYSFFVLGLLLLLLSCFSCTPATKEPSQRKSSTLIVLDVMLYEDGWKSCASIRLDRRRTYSLKLRVPPSPATALKEYHGEVSLQLCSDLESLVASNTIHLVEGIPTFVYYPDDSHHSKPQPIERLYRTVMGRHLVGN